MERYMNVKTRNQSVFIASSLLVLSVAFTSPAHATIVVVGTPAPTVVVGAPVYHGYGYRTGYYGYGYTNRYGAVGYGHGTAYHYNYHGNTAVHRGYYGTTAVHNGHVYHRNYR